MARGGSNHEVAWIVPRRGSCVVGVPVSSHRHRDLCARRHIAHLCGLYGKALRLFSVLFSVHSYHSPRIPGFMHVDPVRASRGARTARTFYLDPVVSSFQVSTYVKRLNGQAPCPDRGGLRPDRRCLYIVARYTVARYDHRRNFNVNYEHLRSRRGRRLAVETVRGLEAFYMTRLYTLVSGTNPAHGPRRRVAAESDVSSDLIRTSRHCLVSAQM